MAGNMRKERGDRKLRQRNEHKHSRQQIMQLKLKSKNALSDVVTLGLAICYELKLSVERDSV